MPYGRDRVIDNHSGARKAHYPAHALSHVGPVTMYAAAFAAAFGIAEGTAPQTILGKRRKFLALGAKPLVALLVTAVQPYHLPYHFNLLFNLHYYFGVEISGAKLPNKLMQGIK